MGPMDSPWRILRKDTLVIRVSIIFCIPQTIGAIVIAGIQELEEAITLRSHVTCNSKRCDLQLESNSSALPYLHVMYRYCARNQTRYFCMYRLDMFARMQYNHDCNRSKVYSELDCSCSEGDAYAYRQQ